MGLGWRNNPLPAWGSRRCGQIHFRGPQGPAIPAEGNYETGPSVAAGTSIVHQHSAAQPQGLTFLPTFPRFSSALLLAGRDAFLLARN